MWLILVGLVLFAPVLTKAASLIWTTNSNDIEVSLGAAADTTIGASFSDGTTANIGLICLDCGSNVLFFDKGEGQATIRFSSQTTDKPGKVTINFSAYNELDKNESITGSINFIIKTVNDTISGASPTTLLNGLEDDVQSLNKLGTTNVNKLIGRVIKTIMSVLGSVAFVLFVYGGVLWMTAAGNAERAGEGRKILTWTALGLVVILGSYGLVDFVFQAFQ